MVSEVTLTSRIRGSVLATVLMPCLRNDIAMSFDQSPYHIQLPGSEAVVCCKLNGLKPELTRLPFPPDVDVNRLVAVKAIKEEPIGSGDVLDSWHSNAAVFFINNATNFKLPTVLISSHLTLPVTRRGPAASSPVYSDPFAGRGRVERLC